MQKKPAARLFNSFFPLDTCNYAYALEQLKLYILRKRRYHLYALFFTQIYLGLEFYSSVLETVGLQVPTCYIRGFSIFALLLKVALLLEAFQLLLFVGTLTYLEPKLFLLIIFYNCSS
jgi:hypothetical protein